jgi:hypothetical protein
MRKPLIYIIILLFSSYAFSATIDNWKITRTRSFKANNLYGHIDGGAEVFLELGFKELIVDNYSNGKNEITIDKYIMDSPESALAIYLLKCGKEKPISSIKSRNTGDRFQITILKGDCYFQVSNPNGKSEILKDMITIANACLEKVKDIKPKNLLAVLPSNGLIKNSQTIFRGPFSMQSIYTFGEGDPLLQKGKIFGVSGDYKDNKNGTYTKIIINYPDNNTSNSAYKHLISSLDKTKKIIEQKPDVLIFKDHAGKFGIIKLSKNLIEIDVNIKNKP